MNRNPARKPIGFVLAVCSLGLLFYVLNTLGYTQILENSALLKAKIAGLGALGPLITIAAMTLAVVASPIPSAPIALAAGALYGHTWGTLYVLTGATLGAVIAFLIARMMGVDLLRRWFGGRLATSWVGSQNTLMGIVFFSRLLPFVSFDIVSYAAGLTALGFWRFTLATVAGVAPASFLLAHFGAELSSTQGRGIALGVLALGLVTAGPVIYRAVKKRNSHKAQ